MNDRRILAGLLKIKDLPTLPQVVTRIVELAEDETASAHDFTAVLESDYAISARILRLANSPYYGLPNRVDSIGRAVVLLGFDAVRNLALATTVVGLFADRKQTALTPEDFWMHAFGAAKAAQLLCRQHCRVESPEGCFTAALLHDMGKYLFALILKDDYLEVVAQAQKVERPLHEIETERFGMDHAEVGAWLLEKWCFPQMFRDAIANLYSHEAYAGPYAREIAIVALSSALSHRAGFGRAGEAIEPALDSALLTPLGLDRAGAQSIATELEEYREETRDFLSLLAGG
jgi:HD-like signal output (HDOD) protein